MDALYIWAVERVECYLFIPEQRSYIDTQLTQYRGVLWEDFLPPIRYRQQET